MRRTSGAREAPAGSSEAAPLVLGDETDAAPVRVRVLEPVAGLARGRQVWVAGRGAEEHISSGALLDITRTAQRRRLWRVGEHTYTSLADAKRVAAARGLTPIEVA